MYIGFIILTYFNLFNFLLHCYNSLNCSSTVSTGYVWVTVSYCQIGDGAML